MALAVTPGGYEMGPERVEAAAFWNSQNTHSEPSDLLVIHEGAELAKLGEFAGSEVNDVRCSLDLSAPPRQRRQLLAALAGVDGLSNVVGIESPVALFAGLWHANPFGDPDRPLRIVACADTVPTSTGSASGPELDTEAEEHRAPRACSVLVADTNQRRLLAVGLVQSEREIEELVLKAARAMNGRTPDVMVESDFSGPSSLAQIESVHAFGLNDAQRQLFNGPFGDLVQEGADVHAVLHGLTRLESLADWTTTWPTTRLHLGSGWTRQPGPLRATVEEHLTRLRPQSGLRFSDGAGREVAVRAGSVVASGCEIPDRLGAQPRLRLVDDGRLLMLGPPGTRPLAIQFAWPVPASGRTHVDVRSASSGGIELTNPYYSPATMGVLASEFAS